MTDPTNKSAKSLGDNLKAAFQDTLDEGVPDEFRKLIDDNLKKAYNETLDEGVPDRFATLMAQLKDASDGKKS